MPNSYVVATGDGSINQYDLPFSYIRKEHVTAAVNYVDAPFTWVNDSRIQITTTPPNGQRVEVRRTTPLTSLLVDFSDGSTPVASDFDTSNYQHLYKAQELDDNLSQTLVWTSTGIDANSQPIVNVVDPTTDQGAATKKYVDDNIFPKILSTDSWSAVDTKTPTTSATDARIDSKIDTALTGDVSGGAGITVTDNSPSTGQIAVSITDSGVTEAKINDGAVTINKIPDNILTLAKLAAAAVVTNSEQAAATVNDTSLFTTQAADSRYFRQDSTETIDSGATWSGSNSYIATTQAIDNRIIDLLEETGGFVPVGNETSFPAANPDINNSGGTLVSIKAIASTRTPSGGTVTITDGAGSGNTVSITGCGSTVLTAGFGVILETTSTLHTYAFHRLVPKAGEVTTVATNASSVATCATNIAKINNFADLYLISASAPTTRADSSSLQEGDLWYDTTQDGLKAYDGDSWEPFSPNQTQLNQIAVVAGEIVAQEDLGAITESINTSSGNDLETIANNITNIGTLADVQDGTVATNALSTLAGISGNITAVGSNTTNVNTVAASIGDVNRYAVEYVISTSSPSSPSAGRLWYDVNNNVLKYHNGSGFVNIQGGLQSLLDDTTPELGGHLDCNDKNLTEVGTISGDNLQMDFGSLT